MAKANAVRMTAEVDFDLSRYMHENYPGLMKHSVVLRCAADLDVFLDAVNAFKRGAGRAAALKSLCSLGIPADKIGRIASGESLTAITAG